MFVNIRRSSAIRWIARVVDFRSPRRGGEEPPSWGKAGRVMGMERMVVTAAAGTPCGWKAYGEAGTLLTCESGRDAIHVLTGTLPVGVKGTALCAYHSPWDVTDADRAEQSEKSEIGRAHV